MKRDFTLTCAEMKRWQIKHFLDGLGTPLENVCTFELPRLHFVQFQNDIH